VLTPLASRLVRVASGSHLLLKTTLKQTSAKRVDRPPPKTRLTPWLLERSLVESMMALALPSALKKAVPQKGYLPLKVVRAGD